MMEGGGGLCVKSWRRWTMAAEAQVFFVAQVIQERALVHIGSVLGQNRS